MLGDGVSQLASNLFRFGSKKRGVCICNAQCRLQSLGEGPLGPTIRTHHGSLDRLLQQEQRVGTIGDVVDGSNDGGGALLGSAESVAATSEEEARHACATGESGLPPRLPPRGPLASRKAMRVKEEFDRGVEVEKFYHQINGDIFEITRRVRARDEDTIEQKCIKRKGSVRLPPEPPPPPAHRAQQAPSLPPRRQKSAEEVPRQTAMTAPHAHDELEWFDRRAQQRHSARSAESGAVREETIEWLDRQRGPTRTSSGPSEITVLKDEVPEWLLEHLPRKRTKPQQQQQQQPPQQQQQQQQKQQQQQQPQQQQPSLPAPPPAQIEAGRTSATSYAKAFKEELAELLKKPLSRQSSGPPGEFSLLKTDIVDWLTKLQSTKTLPRDEVPPASSVKARRAHHRRNGSGGDTPRSHSQEDAGQREAARKRHSFGHSDTRTHSELTDWIAFPLNRLQSLGKSVTSQSGTTSERTPLPQTQPLPSCCERRHHHERSRERKLRHSASEVVTGGSGGQPIYAKPHKERYQYVPKDMDLDLQLNLNMLATPVPPLLTTRESKRERSRRHQTQRSATVSDMSGHLNGNQKRKSSSAERAPRSPSPCNDPACPLLPICTDPHCRFLECQTVNRMSTSASTANIVAKAQVHSVPPYAASDLTTSTPPPAPPLSAPPVIVSSGPAVAPKRKLVIYHECRSCAPLLT